MSFLQICRSESEYHILDWTCFLLLLDLRFCCRTSDGSLFRRKVLSELWILDPPVYILYAMEVVHPFNKTIYIYIIYIDLWAPLPGSQVLIL